MLYNIHELTQQISYNPLTINELLTFKNTLMQAGGFLQVSNK